MNASDVTTLYAYNVWANRRILSAARSAQPEAFLTASLGYARLRETLVHLVSAEWIWRERWQGTSPTAMLDPADFPTLDALAERWEAEQPATEALLAELADAELNERLAYTTQFGTAYSTVLWHTLTHVLLHSMQHRAELALLLTELGHSPGDLDLITYVREQHL